MLFRSTQHIHTHTHILYTHTYTHTYIHIYYIHSHIHTHTYTYTIYTHIHTHTYTYTIYTHTYTHTHIHTHILYTLTHTHTHIFAITINDFKFFRAVVFREEESGCPCQAPSLLHSHREGGPGKSLRALCQPGQDGPTMEQTQLGRLECVADTCHCKHV